jgi:large subunit ribosomal protein L29
MPNTRAEELRTMPDDELETRLRERKHELFNVRFKHITGQQDNTAKLGDLRRDIARIKTILRDREIEAAEAAEDAAAGDAAADAAPTAEAQEGVTDNG